jgi:hypothetical protein
LAQCNISAGFWIFGGRKAFLEHDKISLAHFCPRLDCIQEVLPAWMSDDGVRLGDGDLEVRRWPTRRRRTQVHAGDDLARENLLLHE